MSRSISSEAQTIQCIGFFLVYFSTFVDVDSNEVVSNATIRLLTFASSDPKYGISFVVINRHQKYGELFKIKAAYLCLVVFGM